MKTARQEARIDIEAKQRQRHDSNSILDYGQWKHQQNEDNNLPRSSEVQVRGQQAGDQQREARSNATAFSSDLDADARHGNYKALFQRGHANQIEEQIRDLS